MSKLQTNPNWEAADYPYSFRNMEKRYRDNKEKYDILRESVQTMRFREAMNSDDLAGFQPDLFLPEIIQIGQQLNLADNIFGTESQTQQSEFKVRYRSRTDGAQVVREGGEFKQSKSSRETTEFSFLKLGDFPFSTWERISDSLINEMQIDMNLSFNKILRLRGQCMGHVLTLMSQGTNATHWNNFRLIDAPYVELESIDAALQESYIELTTRLRDRLDPRRLQILWSPRVFSLFFKDSRRQSYITLGSTPVFASGSLPTPYGIANQFPYETGYFNTDMEWTPTNDVFLFDPMCATNRIRIDLRVENFQEVRNQTAGALIWERRMPYVRLPFYYERISGFDEYTDILPDLSDLILEPDTETAIASADD